MGAAAEACGYYTFAVIRVEIDIIFAVFADSASLPSAADGTEADAADELATSTRNIGTRDSAQTLALLLILIGVVVSVILIVRRHNTDPSK